MEKSELLDFVNKYVEHKRFTSKSVSIPEARAQDLAKLTEMAGAMRPHILERMDKPTAETICSAYYLGKYDIFF